MSLVNIKLKTNSGKIVVCKIKSADELNVYYQFNPVNGKKIKRFIPKADVKYISTSRSAKITERTAKSTANSIWTVIGVVILLLVIGVTIFAISYAQNG